MSAAAADWSGRGAAYAASPVHRSGPSLPVVSALLRPQPSDVILDVGTGTGHTAAYLARWSKRVTGIDPEPDMVAAAQAAYGGHDGPTFLIASADALPFPDRAFDAAVARHTLHHHRDAVATLREVRRVLRPGGRFVLVDEAAPSAELHDWFESIERERDPSHVATRDLDAWASLLADAGLSWVLGDARTTYALEIGPWLDRSATPPDGRDRVLERFRSASESVRTGLAVAYRDGEPVRFYMPMNIVLARREEP